MNEILLWLSNNPQITVGILIALLVLFLAVVLMFLVAFFQGREISFWPPKIGAKPDASANKQNDTPPTESVFWHKDSRVNYDRISGAKTIDWMSFTLNQTVPILHTSIENCLKNHGRVRVLILDPYSDTPEIVARSGYIMGDALEVKKAIFKTLKRIYKWRQEIPECNVDVRLLAGMSPYRIAIFDRDFPSGYLNLRIPVFCTTEDKPMLRIQASEKKTFSFLVDQYEMYWKHSTPIPDLSKFGVELGKALGENF